MKKPPPKNIIAEIAAHSALGLEEMRTRYQTAFGKPATAALSRDLLLRILAWRLQEKAFGGHDRKTEKLLQAYAKGRPESRQLSRRLKPGTTLVREYQGTRHTVTIVPDGYIWEEKTYPSLTVIAGLITGTNWNGPRFFGLRVPERKRNALLAGQTQ